MKVELIIMILIIHWIADFVMQTDKEAKGKSESFIILLQHAGSYTGVFVFCLLAITAIAGPVAPAVFTFLMEFAFITFISHAAIDYYTSRVHKKLYMEKKHHEFFTSIGFDQLLHYIQLFTTFTILT